MLGQAKFALCFKILFQASLHGILKSIAHYAAQMALRFRFAQKLLGENAGLRLASKRGYVVKKHLQARLRVSFIKQIWHSRSESTRCCISFLSVYILVIRGLKFLAAKRCENAKNDGLTVVKTFYTFHTCLQQQL
jgi:hypothetical protein